MFTFCNATNNFYVGGSDWVFMLADFGEVIYTPLLAILAT